MWVPANCYTAFTFTLSCRYRPRDARMNSETFHYKRGANQVFSQTVHVVDPTKFPDEDVRRLSTFTVSNENVRFSTFLVWGTTTQGYPTGGFPPKDQVLVVLRGITTMCYICKRFVLWGYCGTVKSIISVYLILWTISSHSFSQFFLVCIIV